MRAFCWLDIGCLGCFFGLGSANDFVDGLWADFEEARHFGDGLAICDKCFDLLNAFLGDSTPCRIGGECTSAILADVALCATTVASKADTLM